MRTNTNTPENPPIMVPSFCYGHLKAGQKPADVLVIKQAVGLPAPVSVLKLQSAA